MIHTFFFLSDGGTEGKDYKGDSLPHFIILRQMQEKKGKEVGMEILCSFSTKERRVQIFNDWCYICSTLAKHGLY